MAIDAGLGSLGHDSTGHDSTGHDSIGQDRDEWAASDQQTAGFSNPGSRRGDAKDTPDPRKLAQDWVTLWQSELTAMAADPEMRESWQTIVALWAGSLSTLLNGLPRGNSHARPEGQPRARRQPHTRQPDASQDDEPSRQAGAADAKRPAAAASAPDPRDAEIERLARHVAALEQRLADLERGGNPPVHPKLDPKRRPGGRKQRR